MTKEEIIKELEQLKNDKVNELANINAKHLVLTNFIAELNYVLQKARDDNARTSE